MRRLEHFLKPPLPRVNETLDFLGKSSIGIATLTSAVSREITESLEVRTVDELLS